MSKLGDKLKAKMILVASIEYLGATLHVKLLTINEFDAFLDALSDPKALIKSLAGGLMDEEDKQVWTAEEMLESVPNTEIHTLTDLFIQAQRGSGSKKKD